MSAVATWFVRRWRAAAIVRSGKDVDGPKGKRAPLPESVELRNTGLAVRVVQDILRQAAPGAGGTIKVGDRNRLLRVALVAFGIAFLCIYPLMVVWPSGWAWQPSQHEYEQRIVGIYATLGFFLIWASREPEA